MNKITCAVVAAMFAVSLSGAAFAQYKDRLGDMHHAIEKLEHAKSELQAKRSGDEYDGYRERAIRHLDEALHELHEAVEFAKSHPRDVKHH
jgi:hypothetical protein